jgi:hypothetical protein
VVESIDRWKILSPQITSLESSVEGGDRLVVTGTVENPDIGDIRRVRVRVEALGPSGAVLAEAEGHVRPKTLGPGSHGAFTVRFKDVDASSALRTRASVVEWESEVLDAG